MRHPGVDTRRATIGDCKYGAYRTYGTYRSHKSHRSHESHLYVYRNSPSPPAPLPEGEGSSWSGQLHQAANQPLDAEQAANGVHHPTQPIQFPTRVGGRGRGNDRGAVLELGHQRGPCPPDRSPTRSSCSTCSLSLASLGRSSKSSLSFRWVFCCSRVRQGDLDPPGEPQVGRLGHQQLQAVIALVEHRHLPGERADPARVRAQGDAL
jgi:hypothetical protein